MEQKKKYADVQTVTVKKNNYSYLMMNIGLLIVLPVISIVYELHVEHEPFGWPLIGKWFIFWAVGIRLFTAGISQASNPGFTANIFKMRSREGFVVIRELGFANISMGIMGILSAINNNWRPLAAMTGGLFLGIAGIQHLFKKPDSQNEVIAMVYDLSAMIIIGLYLCFTVFA